METFLKIFGAAAAILLLALFLIPLGTLMGAVTGSIVGYFFGATLLPVFAKIGLGGFTMGQIGAFFGFVGAFFRSSLTTTKA